MNKSQKGLLIVLEGIDGGGKSTQAQMLIERLRRRGWDTVYYREPSQGKWGRKIKDLALQADAITPEQELELFQKDRRENVEKNLKPALAQNKIIILDRYYFSTIAYQGAKGIDTRKIQEMNEKFVVKPDLVFILDVDAACGLERIKDRGPKDLLFEREEYLVKVRAIFNQLRGDNIFHIDANRRVEDIADEIEKKVLEYLSDHFRPKK